MTHPSTLTAPHSGNGSDPAGLAYLPTMSEETDREPDPRTAEDWIRDAAAESIFWPVIIVIVLVAVTLGGGILRIAVADRNIAALAALAVLLWMSVDIVRQERKIVRQERKTVPQETERAGFGLVSKLVIGWWVASAVAAIAFPFLY